MASFSSPVAMPTVRSGLAARTSITAKPNARALVVARQAAAAATIPATNEVPKDVLARAIQSLANDAATRKAASDALAALLKEKEELQLANKELQQQNSQLLAAMAASAQRVVEIVFPSRELPSRLFIKTTFFNGKGMPLLPGMPGSGITLGQAVKKFVDFIIYDVLAAGVLYYAAWLATGAAPSITPQFVLGAVAVALLLPAISSAVLLKSA